MDRDPSSSPLLDTSLLRDHAAYRSRDPSRKAHALIKATSHPSLPIAIYNYTSDITGWDPLTLASRALVVEPQTGRIVSRSFSKLFNHLEPLAYKPTGDEEAIVVEEKLDGSIISVFWYRGGWHAISKSQFTGPYVDLANKILNQRYRGAREQLNKDKTYVFKMLNPNIPIGVKYAESDMVLLSIISKDGQEPPFDYDWSNFPFTRPRILDARIADLNVLRKMNPANEEGFVVKFYPRSFPLRPQRVKVKFDSYLSLIQAKSHVSPAGMLKVYTKSRGAIPELNESLVTPRMVQLRDKYIDSLRDIADDMGGDAWLLQVQDQWEKIDGHFVCNEKKWRQLTATLIKEGYTTGTTIRDRKKQFTARLGRRDVEVGLRQVLHLWFAGASAQDQIRCFLGTLPVPDEWKKMEALGDRKAAVTVTAWK